MLGSPFSKELQIAQLAVQRASLLTKRVLAQVDNGALDKKDKTPVTIADFGAQALIIAAIHASFPDDEFIGEETSEVLRKDTSLCERVWNLVKSTKLDHDDAEALLETPATAESMMDIIDLGKGTGGRMGRVWMLDPVDGTATFMRNQQYAVCLCLTVDGRQKVGVLGCPNLNLDDGKVSEMSVPKQGEGSGYLLSAVAGQGAMMTPLTAGRLGMPKVISARTSIRDAEGEWDDLDFVESTGSKSLDLALHQKIAASLSPSSKWPGTDLWSSQMRYVAMAVGGGDIMLRMYAGKGHHSYVWDHAGGFLIFEESGGKVTDLQGREIDFGCGRTLSGNDEMVAAPAIVHDAVLSRVREVVGKHKGL